MTERLSRRSFFKLAGGGIAAAIIAPKLLAEKIISIPVEFGWTWHVPKKDIPPSLHEIVVKTLRENTQKIAENITSNNSLLVKLEDGHKFRLDINPITPEEQNRRMLLRMEQRLEEKQQQRIKDKPSNNGRMYKLDPNETAIYYDGYENVGEEIWRRENRTQKA